MFGTLEIWPLWCVYNRDVRPAPSRPAEKKEASPRPAKSRSCPSPPRPTKIGKTYGRGKVGPKFSHLLTVRAHRALDTGQFRFWSKFKVPFLCSEMATLDHLGYFMQHLMNKMVIFLFKVWKKWISKTGKMRKRSKTANFGHVLVFLSD